jgi:hypothetical protein
MKSVLRALHALIVVTASLLLGPWQSAAANSLQDLGDSSPAALRAPHVFVVYWGPEWTQGFTSNNVTSAQYRNYLESFLGALGGSRLLGTQTQYGAGNPFDLFAGQVRFFPTEPPATPTLDDIENVVQLSQQWFSVARPSGISNQQIFIIALPPGHGDASFAAKGGPACAFHDDTLARVVGQGGLFLGQPIDAATYVVLPYQPDSNVCFAFNVSSQADAFGHGSLDGLSKAVGHELAEVLTDPYLGSWRDPDVSGQDETGDKCNTGPLTNYGRQTGGIWSYWGIQALWSNSAGHCDLGIAGRIDNPPDVNFGPQLIGGAIRPQFVDFTNTGDADVQIGAPGVYWTVDDPSVSFLVVTNNCPASVHPGASCRIGAAFVPHASGQVSARVTLSTAAAPGVPLASVQLSGTGTNVPWLATPGNGQFVGNVPVGCSDCQNEKSIVFVNVDSFAHVIARASLSQLGDPEFGILSDGCSNTSLNPGQSCTLQVAFLPLAGGQRFAVASVDDDHGTRANLLLTGTGTGAVAQFSGPALFGSNLSLPHARLGAAPTATVTLTAQSVARGLSLGAIAVSGPFAQSNDCPAFLHAGTSCSVTVTGYPTALGAQTGVLSVSHDGIGGPKQISITGLADGSYADIAPLRIDFGETRVGRHSSPRPVALVPAENGAVHVIAVTATGDFQVQNHCANPVQSRCELSVVFSPQRSGLRSGLVSITTDALNPRQTVTLIGSGAAEGECKDEDRDDKSRRCEDD